jgi:arginyl-tRNA synthetase
MEGAYSRLDEADLLEADDGAMVVFPPGFTNREGEPLPLIAKSSAGAFMYATSDVACVLDRVERLGADLMLYVVGAPQRQHLEMVFEVCRMAGWLVPPTEAIHVSFGSVLGDDRKVLRSRAGEAVKLVDLLDEAVDRARAAIAEKNPTLESDERDEVARMVGIGAVKYADLSTDRVKDYVFDLDRMVSFDGNTAPYIQYAHARINQVFAKAGVERGDIRGAPIVLEDPRERALAIRLLGLPTAIDATLETYSPHKLANYAYDLATDFTSFYEHCPIVRSDEPTRTSRLVLSDLTARVIERTLGLLGIDAPERM